MARRGHSVYVLHRAVDGDVGCLNDVSWCTFEGSIEHRFAERFTPLALPVADFIFDAAPRPIQPQHGLPLIFVQGTGSAASSSSAASAPPARRFAWRAGSLMI
jgi:hypothetical protein